jgi:3-oxoacyl-[acyl-carrier-protein] synthase II
MDRTSQLAVIAARQAVADAKVPSGLLRSGRVALVYGVCTGGIGAPDGPGLPFNSSMFLQAAIRGDQAAERDLLERLRGSAVYAPTQEVAADLGITGPCLTVSNACAASTSAMASALTLLNAGRVDMVVVGGAEAWSRFTFACFYSIGAMAEQPTSPFSRSTGASFGEAGGCMILERPEDARARGVPVHGMLLGCGGTADAHHITAPNPAGQGLMRAMKLALDDAGLPTDAVGYINAHGTGTTDNDVAETVAIHRLFEGHEPPVSSSKSFFGHTLGAAGVLEFIASLISMKAGFMPPTLNFRDPRPGCDLDYVPNVARASDHGTFLSLSAAFGGVNAVAVGARADTVPASPVRPCPPQSGAVAITGIGVVSPIGFGADAFRTALRGGKSGVKPITRFNPSPLALQTAAMVQDLPARRLAPAADTRRMDPITQFAVVAATLALNDAGLMGRIAPERLGLHVALSDGPASSTQLFGDELAAKGLDGLGAKFFPPIVLSTIGGMVGQSCQIRGASFTFTDGAGAGLSALAHAHDFLLQHDELDAIVVVAADEIALSVCWMAERRGDLAKDGRVSVYDPDGSGLILGEGSVALVLERTGRAKTRGGRIHGRIGGVALGAEGRRDENVDETGAILADVAMRAMAGGGEAPPDIVYGLARGAARHDRREAAALRHAFGTHPVPVTNLNGQLGFASATSGLYAAAAALLGARHGEAYPTRHAGPAIGGLNLLRDETVTGTFNRALVLGSSEHGHSAAVLLDAGL